MVAQMVPERNRTHYSTDEKEFDLNEGFVEPHSIILKTPMKREKALTLRTFECLLIIIA